MELKFYILHKCYTTNIRKDKNLNVLLVNSENHIIYSLLRSELSSGESEQIYVSEESRNEFVEEF